MSLTNKYSFFQNPESHGGALQDPRNFFIGTDTLAPAQTLTGTAGIASAEAFGSGTVAKPIVVAGFPPLQGGTALEEEKKKKRKRRKRDRVPAELRLRTESAARLPPIVTPIRTVEPLPVADVHARAIATAVDQVIAEEAEARRLAEQIQEEDELLALGVL